MVKKKITQQWCKPFSPEWYLKGILELQQNSSCETSISQMQSHLSICSYQISKQSVKTRECLALWKLMYYVAKSTLFTLFKIIVALYLSVGSQQKE